MQKRLPNNDKIMNLHTSRYVFQNKPSNSLKQRKKEMYPEKVETNTSAKEQLKLNQNKEPKGKLG